jgi:hypothetical protein
MHWKIPIFLLASVSALFSQQMDIGDVRKALAQAVQESLIATPGVNRVIAITDREGHFHPYREWSASF